MNVVIKWRRIVEQMSERTKKLVVHLYNKYIVKSISVYLLLIVLGIVTFLHLTLTTQIALLETYEGISTQNRIVVNEVVDYPFQRVYVYQNRSENVVGYNVFDVQYIDDSFTVIFVDSVDQFDSFEGVVRVDIEKGMVSLFHVVLGMEKRYVGKALK